MNTQPILKQELDSSISTFGFELSVKSIFPTIQGEGPFAGTPAIFVRLAGCNLRCPQCDTEYTSDPVFIASRSIADYVKEVALETTRLVVITGGEPFRQNITPLVYYLLAMRFRVQIETNGTLDIPEFPYESVTVVCSPKAGKVNPELKKHIHAYKYVVSADNIAEDGLPFLVLGHPAHPRVVRPDPWFKGNIYLQPADHKDEKENKANLAAAIKSCLTFGYILCLQIHKIIDLE